MSGKVILAESAGFCYGVKRAVDLAQKTAEETGGCWMLGDLIHNSFVVEDLAREVHLSKSQLNRLLKEHYGMTFREKLLKTRMDRASWLLKHTEKPIDEVADAVGYRSESAFYQVFRKEFSITPEKYRFQKKKEQEEQP